MNKAKLENLLEAYYNGETTVEEEKRLIDYFATATDIPAEFEADKGVFTALGCFGNDAEMPDTLGDKLDAWMAEELDKEEVKRTPNKRIKLHVFRRITIAAAATIALFIGLKFIVEPNTSPRHIAPTELSLEESAMITQKVLIEISNQLNKGVNGARQVDQQLEEVNRILKKVNKTL